MVRWYVPTIGLVAVAVWMWHARNAKTCRTRQGAYIVRASTPCNHTKLLDLMYRCQRVVLAGEGPCARRIRKRWDGMIHELLDRGSAPAVTHDKTTIRVCLDGDPSIDTLMFVVLHELAHVGCKSTGHTDEFWEGFASLLATARRIGAYTPHDPASRICGTEVGPAPRDLSSK